MAESEEVVVTRVVRRTVVAPAATAVESAAPIQLDVSFVGDYGTLDPQLALDDNGLDVLENLFVGLTRYDLASDQVVPALAQTWESASGGRQWTFELRDDIFWVRAEAEGLNPLRDNQPEVTAVRPVVAADVVFAVQRLCDARMPTADVFIYFIIEGCQAAHSLDDEVTQADLDRIGVTAPDDETVVFRLTEPAGYFLTMTSLAQMRPVPAELVVEMGEEWTMEADLLTSGPFVLSPETVRGTRTVLRRNPHWPLPRNGNVDVVSIFHLDSAVDAFELWQERNLDLSPMPVGQQEDALRRYGSRVRLVPEQAVFYLAFNFNSPVFGEPALRRAFSWAIDRERLIEEVYGGRGLPMRHLAPPGTVGAPPPDEVGMGYNPDRARLQMANSSQGDCRLLPTMSYMVSSSDLALQQAELLRDMWMEELGCNENQFIIEQVQFGTLLANTRPDAGAVRPDMWDLGWAPYYPDENNWVRDLLHCVDSENRPRRPCSPADDLMIAAARSTDVDERWELYRRVERALFGEESEEPVAPLFARADYVLVQSWISYTPAYFGGEQFDQYQVDAEVKALEKLR